MVLTATIRDVTDRKHMKAAEHLLAEAGRVLASPLHETETHDHLARLAVTFADVCVSTSRIETIVIGSPQQLPIQSWKRGSGPEHGLRG